jgi:hypothetical protein
MPSSPKGEERSTRAAEFARRLSATGLSITEFQRQSGLTRNVIYNLSKGQRPSSPEQETKIEDAFRRLAK